MDKDSPSSISSPVRNAERGNVFLFILIGIILFAGLSYTVARSFRNENTDRMSDRRAVVTASDILSYTQRIRRGVDRLRRKGLSESDIRFDNPPATENSVFHNDGGRINWQDPPNGASSGTWIFTGATCVVGIGSGNSGCGSNTDSSDEDLLLVLPDIDQALCTAINEKLNLAASLSDSGDGHSTAAYAGTFSESNELDITGNPRTACYTDGTNVHFYAVLLER